MDLGGAVGIATGILDTGVNLWGTAKQVQLANENLGWQKEFSKTRHQRAVADLKKAGLNPILSATKGLAPQGGTTGTSIPNLQATNAAEKLQALTQIKLAKATTAKTVNDAHVSEKQAEKLQAEIDILRETLGAAAWKGDKAREKQGYYHQIKNWITNSAKAVKEGVQWQLQNAKEKAYDKQHGTAVERSKKRKPGAYIKHKNTYYDMEPNH